MKNRLISLLLLLSMCASLLLSGCSSASAQATNLMETIRSNEIAANADLSEGVGPITDFGAELFRTAHENGSNTLVSPLSVLTALAMTANGAGGETLAQMEEVFGLTVEELNDYLHTYMAGLPQAEDSKLSLANSIWFRDDESFTVNADFLQTCADYYAAGAFKAPFDDTTVKDINNWVKKNTDDMIDGILDQIPEEAVMYLINALAFDAKWQEEYKDTQVREGQFIQENGDVQAVDLMWSEESTYLMDDTTRGFLKYYKGHDYAFVALLPNEGISIQDYAQSLTGEKLRGLLESAEGGVAVTAAIPKFESEYETELSQVLGTMGMTDAFDGDMADLSGLGSSTLGDLYISQVLHKTYIDLSEQGTKAASVTAVEVACESAVMFERTETVVLDRPFLYLLVDCENELPLFIGTLMDPGGEVVDQVEVPSCGGDGPVEEVFQNSPAMEPSNVQPVYAEWNYANILMTLPQGWAYEVSQPDANGGDLSISFWPEGQSEGKIRVSYHEFFGVCGTGLASEDITLPSGLKGWQGTYDGGEVWDFIVFQELPGDYVALNEGAESWWEEYGEEAMSILDTLVMGEGVISEFEATAIAAGLREKPYDVWNVTRIGFDGEKGYWSFEFSGYDETEGGQTVTLDHEGNVVEIIQWDVCGYPPAQ